jgi:hypothetical protein
MTNLGRSRSRRAQVYNSLFRVNPSALPAGASSSADANDRSWAGAKAQSGGGEVAIPGGCRSRSSIEKRKACANARQPQGGRRFDSI